MRRIELGCTTLRGNPLLNEFGSVTVETTVNAFYDILFLASKRANWSSELIPSLNSPEFCKLAWSTCFVLISLYSSVFSIRRCHKKQKQNQFVEAPTLTNTIAYRRKETYPSLYSESSPLGYTITLTALGI